MVSAGQCVGCRVWREAFRSSTERTTVCPGLAVPRRLRRSFVVFSISVITVSLDGIRVDSKCIFLPSFSINSLIVDLVNGEMGVRNLQVLLARLTS